MSCGRPVRIGVEALIAVLLMGAHAVTALEYKDFGRRAEYSVPEDGLYKSPVQLLLDGAGRRLFVACEGTHEVLIVDPRKRRVEARIATGREPFGMALSPDESLLYVSHRWDNDVAVVDLATESVDRRFAVGDDPHQLALSADGRFLFVPNLGTNSLSVMAAETGAEVKLLPMGMAPFGAALGPRSQRLYVTNQYSSPVPFRTSPILELTIVDVEQQYVLERRQLHSTVLGQGVAVSPDGHFAVTALELPKNLVPETQVYQGWMVTYGVALSETRPGGRTAYLLIDEPNLYFADPYGVAFTPDGRYLLITSSGANQVSILDMGAVYRLLQVREGALGVDDATIARYARHLGLSSEYVVARVPTGDNPKGMVISPDGRYAYVANRLSDDITVIDIKRQRAAGSIDLGGPAATTVLRRGARLFNFATISLHNQMSCATCHPENSVDGLVYDIAVDGGMGRNLVDNLTLRGIASTAPFKWTGKNPTLARQEGPRAAQLFFRTHGFEGAENEAIVRFIEAIPQRPNLSVRDRTSLSEFQESGKAMFDRAYDNMGRYIPVANRCVTCHPQPLGTDRRIHDIASAGAHDWDGRFDTPHLINVQERTPFMHDGRCYSLEEIWTEHNPDDTHGVTNEMMKDQLNVLIEYIKTF
jgi:YVTN family beta-propeller protein